ncbi:MAG TPA: transglycosylase SLT domain-containing protein, partial [Thermoanaerobaculia bacterium]
MRRLVAEAAARQGVDLRLVEAVVRAESAWNPAARSRRGAMGLMQLMPETAAELAVA